MLMADAPVGTGGSLESLEWLCKTLGYGESVMEEW
jgi:hypothetical protein